MNTKEQKEMEIIKQGIELLDEWQKDKILMFISLANPGNSVEEAINILYHAKQKILDAIKEKVLSIKA